MTAMTVRWLRVRRYQILLAVLVGLCIVYYSLFYRQQRLPSLDLTRRATIIQYIEARLQEALQKDRGTGCQIPVLDPFDKEVMQFDVDMPKVECGSVEDWVRCHISTCRVTEKVLKNLNNVVCTYKYILYHSDRNYTIGPAQVVSGANPFVLKESDFAVVTCRGNTADKFLSNLLPKTWTGYLAGLRKSVEVPPPPPGRENTLNVLILGFDSTSKNGFIRKMPKSYKAVLDLNAVVLNGYNVVGDGTPASLFPILTGKTELELPDVRKTAGRATLDTFPFVFYKLKEDGYRTVYYEDSPSVGTFQYRFNGFKRQPADHYLRAFYLEQEKSKHKPYCVGDTPQYGLMLNLTKMFFELDGKKYCFTFIADITHNDFNMISTADEDLELFLREFRGGPRKEDTLLLLFGDHGPRYAKVRSVYRGKLEERLPLMAIFLPERLQRERPEWASALSGNTEVLTTPHDIYATVMHALEWQKHWNEDKVPGADLKRGLTLFEPIPSNRSCSEAGIEPHWCTCMRWLNVSADEPLRRAAALAVVDYINRLTAMHRDKCALRTLTTIHWVMRQAANPRLLQFKHNMDPDGYVGYFNANTQILREDFSVKITVGPGEGVYEATMVYSIKEDRFEMSNTAISRTNAYNDEPSCIHLQHPHLNPYCYCIHPAV